MSFHESQLSAQSASGYASTTTSSSSSSFSSSSHSSKTTILELNPKGVHPYERNANDGKVREYKAENLTIQSGDLMTVNARYRPGF